MGSGNNADWVHKGATDAKKFYDENKHNYQQLMNSYNFEWLKQNYEQRYQNTVC